MKQPSNKKQIVAPTAAKPQTKKTLTSEKISAPVKKKADISVPKIKLKTLETSSVKAKTQKLKTFVSNGKIKNADSKNARTPLAQIVKSKAETAKTTTSNLKAANKITKSQPIITLKNIAAEKRQKTVEKVKIEKPEKAVPVKKISTAKILPRVSDNKKTLDYKVVRRIAETTQTEKSIAKTAAGKATAAKSQMPLKGTKPVKSLPEISTKKVKPRISAVKSKIVAAKPKTTGKKTPVKMTTAVENKKARKPSAKVEKKSFNSRISKIAKVADQKIIAVHLVKKLNLPANPVGQKSKKASRKEVLKPFEIKAEAEVLEVAKPKPKKAKAISSAVFRGAKNRYDFTVFPLDAVFEDVPAIYVISRRIVDKSKKAHHALVCIGQTESLLDELKKHKKDKRAKKFAANSISLLCEENETRRLKIETDLKAAHNIPCLHA